MIRTLSNPKKPFVVLAISLISLVTITAILTSGFAQSNFRINVDTIINQITNQSSLPTNSTDINKTDSLNAANSYSNYSSEPINTDPISSDNSNSSTYEPPDLSRLFFSFSYNPYPPLTAIPISLDASKFITYTYGGYPVQQPDLTQLFLTFPDTNQGQLAGSDAINVNTCAIQKIEFDSVFITPKIGALGFDEMVVFAASDTSTYKGTEFGIRLDLSDGFIYGYIQEPNGNYGDVNFQMLNLMPNDGIIHHYTLIMQGTEVSFFIDGVNYGYLHFPSYTDCSSLTFYILAVVHRFTDNWDSVGDSMIVENFLVNQP